MLYVVLKKALYGCVQSSSKLWSDKLCSVLTENGFTVNPYDPCVCNKTEDDGYQVTVCFHVDDLLTSKSTQASKSLENCLSKIFSEITFTRGDSHSYLSMNIVRNNNYWEIDMKTYIEKYHEGKVLRHDICS